MKRSNEANARLWMIYHAMSEKMKVRGETFSAETWHRWAKSRFLASEEVKLPNGQLLIVHGSTADLDTAAFNDYMTAVEAWANEHDVYLDELPA
jgi:hypothetical protein